MGMPHHHGIRRVTNQPGTSEGSQQMCAAHRPYLTQQPSYPCRSFPMLRSVSSRPC